MEKKLSTFKEMCYEITKIIQYYANRGFEHAVIYPNIYPYKKILPVEMVNMLLDLGFNYGVRNNTSVIGWHDAKKDMKGKIYGKEFEKAKYNYFEKDFDITKVKLFNEMPYFHPIYYIEIFATEAKEISDEKPVPYNTNPFKKPWK